MRVAVLMGSRNDWDVMREAVEVLEELGIPYEARVLSAHRTPDQVYEFARRVDAEFDVVIAGAGGAAHLPGVVAALTTAPVIGVPIPTKHLGGLDSLLSMVQMPRGVPVATVAIGGAANAALLAARMLALKSHDVRDRLRSYMDRLRESVLRNSLIARRD